MGQPADQLQGMLGTYTQRNSPVPASGSGGAGEPGVALESNPASSRQLLAEQGGLQGGEDHDVLMEDAHGLPLSYHDADGGGSAGSRQQAGSGAALGGGWDDDVRPGGTSQPASPARLEHEGQQVQGTEGGTEKGQDAQEEEGQQVQPAEEEPQVQGQQEEVETGRHQEEQIQQEAQQGAEEEAAAAAVPMLPVDAVPAAAAGTMAPLCCAQRRRAAAAPSAGPMRRSGRAARAASGGACSSGTAPRRGVNRQRVQPEELEEEEESVGGAGAVREAGSSESQRDGEGATDDADFDLGDLVHSGAQEEAQGLMGQSALLAAMAYLQHEDNAAAIMAAAVAQLPLHLSITDPKINLMRVRKDSDDVLHEMGLQTGAASRFLLAAAFDSRDVVVKEYGMKPAELLVLIPCGMWLVFYTSPNKGIRARGHGYLWLNEEATRAQAAGHEAAVKAAVARMTGQRAGRTRKCLCMWHTPAPSGCGRCA